DLAQIGRGDGEAVGRGGRVAGRDHAAQAHADAVGRVEDRRGLDAVRAGLDVDHRRADVQPVGRAVGDLHHDADRGLTRDRAGGGRAVLREWVRGSRWRYRPAGWAGLAVPAAGRWGRVDLLPAAGWAGLAELGALRAQVLRDRTLGHLRPRVERAQPLGERAD